MDEEIVLRKEIRFRLALGYKQLAVESETGRDEYLKTCTEKLESTDKDKKLFSKIKKYIQKDYTGVIEEVYKYFKENFKEDNDEEALKRAGIIPDYIMPQFLLLRALKKTNVTPPKFAIDNVIKGIENLLAIFSGSPNILAAWNNALGVVYEMKDSDYNNKAMEHYATAHNYAENAKKHGVKMIFCSEKFGEIEAEVFIGKIEEDIRRLNAKSKEE